VSEGFGRYRHRELARFVDIGRGSAFEVRDLLRDGALRGHWTEAESAALVALCARAIGALTSFSRYLKTNPDVPLGDQLVSPSGRPRRRPKKIRAE